MNKAKGTGSIDRSARVRRIKRVIICLIALMVILPSVMCVVLFFKIAKMEKAIYDLSLRKETHTIVKEETTVVETKESTPVIANAKTSTIQRADEPEAEEGTAVITVENSVKDSKVPSVESNADTKVNSQNKDETEVVDLEKAEFKTYDAATDENQTLKRVYLTFDDGPSNHTEKILDILNEYDVKATFFVNGKEFDTLKPLYKRIVDEGHAIGMHSYTHIYKEVYASEDAFTYDLNKIQDYIYEQTGVLSKIYRFPGGSSNRVSRVPVENLAQILDSRGVKYYDWNVLSGDASSVNGLPADVIANNVINGARGHEDAIVLMHDLPEKSTTVAALPRIIETFKSMGVEILPIDDDTPEYHQDFN